MISKFCQSRQESNCVGTYGGGSMGLQDWGPCVSDWRGGVAQRPISGGVCIIDKSRQTSTSMINPVATIMRITSFWFKVRAIGGPRIYQPVYDCFACVVYSRCVNLIGGVSMWGRSAAATPGESSAPAGQP